MESGNPNSDAIRSDEAPRRPLPALSGSSPIPPTPTLPDAAPVVGPSPGPAATPPEPANPAPVASASEDQRYIVVHGSAGKFLQGQVLTRKMIEEAEGNFDKWTSPAVLAIFPYAGETKAGKAAPTKDLRHYAAEADKAREEE